MATIVKLSSGNYRVQVRRKGQYASKTFRRKADAYAWALEAERRSDQGRAIQSICQLSREISAVQLM